MAPDPITSQLQRLPKYLECHGIPYTTIHQKEETKSNELSTEDLKKILGIKNKKE
jgi:hypothetical protein